MDMLERFAAIFWPSSFKKGLPYLMLLPAIVLVGLLVLGLIQIGDTSLRTLDTNTFLMSETYTLANYQRALTEKFFATVAGRSLIGSLIVTVVTLIFAFPYAYLMVRTPSSALRKFLLVALFLPFFIGQVVRAYGWLIILGNQGMVNEALGLVGIAAGGMLEADQVHCRAIQLQFQGIAIEYRVELGHAMLVGAERAVGVVMIMVIVGMGNGQWQQGEGQGEQQATHGRLRSGLKDSVML